MKKKLPIIAGVVSLVLVVGFGIYFVKTKSKSAENKSTDSQTETKKATSTEKTDNPPSTETQTQSDAKTPTVNSSVPQLNGVSLTVYLYTEQTTSQDGKTTIPANSIFPSFYMEAGTYSAQKLISGSWVDVATGIKYAGHGGLSVPYIKPAEDNVSYRLIKIENDTAKGISKTFTVTRSDLTAGMKTYN